MVIAFAYGLGLTPSSLRDDTPLCCAREGLCRVAVFCISVIGCRFFGTDNLSESGRALKMFMGESGVVKKTSISMLTYK